MPAAIPNARNPRRRDQRLWQKEITIRVKPMARFETTTVRRWVKWDDMKPEHKRVIKYPREISRKKAPASAWLKDKSASTLGRKGARKMRDRKLTKKISVNKSSAGSC